MSSSLAFSGVEWGGGWGFCLQAVSREISQVVEKGEDRDGRERQRQTEWGPARSLAHRMKNDKEQETRETERGPARSPGGQHTG